ncbi:MAG: hypothetical protein APF81_13685 [Desulfosporosinus sp. BRH_c37]|nr:MAG: hypothetical protein APF81_13685 [Desulfosporosinus sp. BRH_c37]
MTCPKCHRGMASSELLYCSECQSELKSLDQKANDIRRLEIAIENNSNPGVLKKLNMMLNRIRMNTEDNRFLSKR